MDYIDDKIEEPGILTVDVEFDSQGGFPDPLDVKTGKIIGISLHITGVGDYICYGIGEPGVEIKKDIGRPGYMYIRCSDEDDMLSRALRYIRALKPKYALMRSGYDFDFLGARAFEKHIKVDVPDLDSMFRQYDRPYSELYGGFRK